MWYNYLEVKFVFSIFGGGEGQKAIIQTLRVQAFAFDIYLSQQTKY